MKFFSNPENQAPDVAAAMFLMQRFAKTLPGKKIINELRHRREPDPDDLVQEEETRPGSTM